MNFASSFPLGPARVLLGSVAALVVASFIGILVISLMGSSPGVPLAQLISVAFFIGTPVLLLARRSNSWSEVYRDISPTKMRYSKLLLWSGVVVGSYLLFSLVYSVFISNQEQKIDIGLLGPPWMQVVFIVILAPISEEIFFRGFVFRGLRRAMPLAGAALLSGLFFGILHITGGAAVVPAIAFLGFLLAVLYEKTETIWAPILLHGINNGLVLLTFY